MSASNITQITSDTQFRHLIAAHPFVVIDCVAAWSGPAKINSQVFDKLALQHQDKPTIVFARFDTDQDPILAQVELGVTLPPATFFYERGNRVDELRGLNTELLEKKVQAMVSKASE